MINPRTWIKELIIEEVFKGIDKKAAELVPKVKYKFLIQLLIKNIRTPMYGLLWRKVRILYIYEF